MGKFEHEHPFEAVRGPGAKEARPSHQAGRLLPDRLKYGWPAAPCKTIGNFSLDEVREMERRYAVLATVAV